MYDSAAANSSAITTFRVNRVAEIVAFCTRAFCGSVEIAVEDSGIASTRAKK